MEKEGARIYNACAEQYCCAHKNFSFCDGLVVVGIMVGLLKVTNKKTVHIAQQNTESNGKCLECARSEAITYYFADVPATGMYFVSYEFLLNALTPAGKRFSSIGKIYVVV